MLPAQPELAQAQVMRQQFLEGEPLLGGVAAFGQQPLRGIGGRAVHVAQRLLQRGHSAGREQLFRQPVRDPDGGMPVPAVQVAQRLYGQGAQGQLVDAFRGRVNRRQMLLDGDDLRRIDQAVFRMDHFRRQRAGAHLAVTAEAGTAAEAGLLRGVEMEKTQSQESGAVADAHQQRAPAPEVHFSQFDLALHHGLVAGAQRAHRGDARAVLVAQRQVKQHVLHGAQTQALESAGDSRSHPLQDRDRQPAQVVSYRERIHPLAGVDIHYE